METENPTCILCGKELDDTEEDFCRDCYPVLKAKYPKTKCLEEQIKCHKRHAKRLRK